MHTGKFMIIYVAAVTRHVGHGKGPIISSGGDLDFISYPISRTDFELMLLTHGFTAGIEPLNNDCILPVLGFTKTGQYIGTIVPN
ncbi:MAG: hypothetical protein ABW085_00075 [Sedimenticola sp.]